jgi:hypothetical protein
MVTSGMSRRSTRPSRSFAHFVGQLWRLLFRRVGKLVRHAELAHRDLDLHAGVVDIAQHFDHAAHRLGIAGRLFGQFDADHLPALALPGEPGQDVLADALVFGHHDPGAVLIEQAADDAGIGALHDFDDGAFGPAAAVGAGDARQHAVAVQHLLHFLLGQEQVVAPSSGIRKP